jgi:hypothetical protein
MSARSLPGLRRWTLGLGTLFAATSTAEAQVRLGTWEGFIGASSPVTLHGWRQSAGLTGDGQPLYRYWFTGTAPGFVETWGSPADIWTDFLGTYGISVGLTLPGVGSVSLYGFGGSNVLFTDLTGRVAYTSTSMYSTAPLIGDAELSGQVFYAGCAYPPSGGPVGCTGDGFPIAGFARIEQAVVTPEPGTWALLGTGLIGLAGVTARRRGAA